MEKTIVKFTDEEKFTIGLFASSMSKKPGVAFKKSDDNNSCSEYRKARAFAKKLGIDFSQFNAK